MRNGHVGAMGRLGIDRCKSVVDKDERRSGESSPRESVWNLRNPNGIESDAEATEDEAKNRVERKNGVVCAFEHHDAEDWWGFRGKTQRDGDPRNEEQWSNRYPKPHIWIFEGEPNHSWAGGSMALQ